MTKQQIIRSWLKERVIEARNQDEIYQRYQKTIPYHFRDSDFINYNPQELGQFGELDTKSVYRPQRNGVNPNNPSDKIIIPFMRYVSCELRVESGKNQDFISYWMTHAKPDRAFRIGGGGPRIIVCETGKIFDTRQNNVDDIIDYCDQQGRNGDYLSEVLSNTIADQTDMFELRKIVQSRKDKYSFSSEFIYIGIGSEGEKKDYLDELSDEKLEEIILGEGIK